MSVGVVSKEGPQRGNVPLMLGKGQLKIRTDDRDKSKGLRAICESE